MSDERAWLEQCVGLAADAVRSGGIPFAGMIIRDGQVVGAGVNRVRANLDPTAHAEVMAIRDACSRLRSHSLRGATLVASAEPCGLCLIAAAVAGVGRIVYAISADEAAELGFDYRSVRRMLREPSAWPFSFEQFAIPGADRPFRLPASARGGAA